MSDEVTRAFERMLAFVTAYGPPGETPMPEAAILADEIAALSHDEIQALLFVFGALVWALAGDAAACRTVLAGLAQMPEEETTDAGIIAYFAQSIAERNVNRG